MAIDDMDAHAVNVALLKMLFATELEASYGVERFRSMTDRAARAELAATTLATVVRRCLQLGYDFDFGVLRALGVRLPPACRDHVRVPSNLRLTVMRHLTGGQVLMSVAFDDGEN